MRKFFLLISILTFAIVANATEIIVTPGTNALQNAVADANANDVLVLGTGTYVENGDFSIDKNLTIQAAENALPVIANRYYIKIEGGADVTFDGIKFDGSLYPSSGASDYCIRSKNASTGEEDVTFINCEFTGYPSHVIYTESADRKWNTITIRNCYFHNNTKSAVYVYKGSSDEHQSCNALTIQNSTFANGTENIIHFKAPDADETTAIVSVDHCTFYNHAKRAINIEKSAHYSINVSNCIFAQPAANSYKSVECSGGSISHCLSYNTGGYSDGTTQSDNIIGNPYFVNSLSGSYDFSLATFSSAYHAASDGEDKNLGDLRWTSNDAAHPTTQTLSAAANVLLPAVAAAWPGDVIILEDGEFVQGDNYTVFDKDLLIKAADNATPIIKFTVPAQLQSGARAEFRGLKFDMTDLYSQDWYEHLIEVRDASDNNRLIFENCEFYNDSKNNSIIYCSSSKKLDSLIINNCKFHDVTKSCVFLQNAGLIGLTISNSTFYNISTNAGSYYAGIIDATTTTGKVRVDHCTFYNCNAMSTSYGTIKFVSSDALVSNCIFAMSESTGDLRAIHMPDNQLVKNCLTFNYTYDSKTGVRNGIIKTDCIFGKNPVFKDAANADFILCYASPARNKGTENTTIGDPRWVTPTAPITIPTTLLPQDAEFFSDSAGVAEGDPRMVDFKVIGSHSYNNTEFVKWKIKVTEDGYYKFTANVTSTNGQKYNMYVLSEDESVVKGQKIGEDIYMSAGTTTFAIDNAINLTAGNYIVKMTNPYSGSKGCVINIVADYAGGITVAVPDTLWPVDAIRSERAFIENDTLHFTDDSHDSYVREQWAKWNINIAEDGKYKVTANTYSSNGQNYRITLKNSDETVTIGTWYGPNNDSGKRRIFTNVIDLTANDYVVIIEDTVKYSHGRIANLVLTYEGGETVNVPGQILCKEAVIGKEDGANFKMYHHLENGDLHYGDNGTPRGEYATWTIHADETCKLTASFDLNPASTSGHDFLIELHNNMGKIDSVAEDALSKYLEIPAAGDYTLKLINRKKWSSAILHGITFTPYVAPADVTMTDTETTNNSWVANVGGSACDVQMNRTILGGMYNTICLPFKLNSTQCKAIFGNDVELYVLESATLSGDILNLQFESRSDIWHGTPILIKTSSDIVNPLFEGVTIENETADATNGGYVTFRGTFVQKEFHNGDQVLLLLANDKLAYPQQDRTLKGFRAYFQINSGSANAPAIRGARIIAGTQVVTAIDLVETQNEGIQKVIEDGQLIIIKNGVRYNALGTMMK